MCIVASMWNDPISCPAVEQAIGGWLMFKAGLSLETVNPMPTGFTSDVASAGGFDPSR
jgi:hypothetical protein